LDSDDEIDPNDLPSLPNSRSSTPTSEMWVASTCQSNLILRLVITVLSLPY
jgi:hypothetical protein